MSNQEKISFFEKGSPIRLALEKLDREGKEITGMVITDTHIMIDYRVYATETITLDTKGRIIDDGKF